MASGQKLFEINEIWDTNKGQRMALTFGTCISPCTQLSVYIYQLLTHLALDKGQSMALTFSICITPCTQFKCAIHVYTILMQFT